MMLSHTIMTFCQATLCLAASVALAVSAPEPSHGEIRYSVHGNGSDSAYSSVPSDFVGSRNDSTQVDILVLIGDISTGGAGGGPGTNETDSNGNSEVNLNLNLNVNLNSQLGTQSQTQAQTQMQTMGSPENATVPTTTPKNIP